MQAGLPRITAATLAAHRTTVPGQTDEIYSPLYDYQTYLAAGQLQLNFFAVPIGQGTTSAPGAAGAKTEADTNLTNAGLLPKGNRFLCTGLEVIFWQGVNPGTGAEADANAGRAINDVYNVSKSGWLRFRIQNRDYILDGPIGLFPPSARLDGLAAIATNLTSGAATLAQIEYAQFAGIPYQIVPTFIESTQNFGVQINWPALVTVSLVARIGVRLRGRLIRDAQ